MEKKQGIMEILKGLGFRVEGLGGVGSRVTLGIWL